MTFAQIRSKADHASLQFERGPSKDLAECVRDMATLLGDPPPGTTEALQLAEERASKADAEAVRLQSIVAALQKDVTEARKERDAAVAMSTGARSALKLLRHKLQQLVTVVDDQ